MSKNVKISNPMKVITGVDTRWSYANVWEPKSINGGTPKYSVSLIIPKSDTKTIAKIQAAIEAAYKEGEAKLKGNGKSVPALSVLKTPLRDGDISPTPIPVRILSPAYCVTRPTIPGPRLPPKSPAIASSANMAVPPAGNFSDEMLIVPGHMIPTEKPHTIHPIRPSNGFVDIEARR